MRHTLTRSAQPSSSVRSSCQLRQHRCSSLFILPGKAGSWSLRIIEMMSSTCMSYTMIVCKENVTESVAQAAKRPFQVMFRVRPSPWCRMVTL
ncbi:unnamed protein product [Ixodes pacificus]